MMKILLINLGIILLYMTISFFVALRLKRNDVVDIGWGIGFIVGMGCTFFQTQNTHWRSCLVSVMVFCWAIRLSVYIFLRNRNKSEDFRYLQWRKEWGKSVIWRSYLQIFILQGFILWIV